MDGWPRRFDPSFGAETEEYASQFRAPSAPDGNMAFAGGRESRNVQDMRGKTNNLWGAMGIDPTPDTLPLVDEPEDNAHTRAIDGLVARLQSYAPSRASFLAPQSIKPDTAIDMARYYQPPADDRIARRRRAEDILSGLSRYENVEFPK